MTVVEIGGYRVEVDVGATAAAHALPDPPGPEACGCWGCRNWIAGRDALVPPKVGELLRALAIPPGRETEVWHIEVNPSRHVYGGWFTLVGRIEQRPADDAKAFRLGTWEVWFAEGPSYRTPGFEGGAVVELHFGCEAGAFVPADPATPTTA